MSLHNVKLAHALIKPDDRIIMAQKEILPLRFPVKQEAFYNPYKPKGLWYAVGTEWIDWVESKMPNWAGDKFYKIEITDKVLKIDTEEKLIAFNRRYVEGNEEVPERRRREGAPNWPLLAMHYSGIEISPYQYEFRFNYMWYYGWDVASGCIWNKSGIKNIERTLLPVT